MKSNIVITVGCVLLATAVVMGCVAICAKLTAYTASVQVVTVEGKRYVLATTAHGVAICPEAK